MYISMYTWTPHKTTKQCVTGMHTKDDHQLTYKPPAPDNLDQWRGGLGGEGVGLVPHPPSVEAPQLPVRGWALG